MWLASSGLAWAIAVHGALVAVAVLTALLRRSWQWVSVAVVLAGCLAAGGVRAWQVTHGPVATLAETHAIAHLEVQVTGEQRTVIGRIGGPATYITADVLQIDGRGQAWVLRQPVVIQSPKEWPGITVGTRVAISGRLSATEPGRPEAAMVKVLGEPRVLGPPPGWLAAVEVVREGLRRSVAHAPPERAALVPALVVGDTSEMTPELEADFRATGLTHLVAVSGSNLTLVLVFVTSVAGWAGARGRVLLLVSVLSVVAYVALCRSEPSVLRAAAMGLVGIAALGRTPASGSGLRHLAVAVLVLCWADPWLSRSWGFTLSVVACGGILCWGRSWSDSLGRWLPGWLAESLAVPLAAQVATQPVVTAISGQVSVAGLVANLVAAPLVGPATVLGLIAALSSVVHPLPAAVAGWAASWVAEGILIVAHSLAALPGAVAAWPATPLGLVAITAGSAAVAVLASRWLASPPVVLLALGVLVVATMRPPLVIGWPPEGWVIMSCDVGQGDATLVRSGPHEAILIDVGPDGAALVACLDRAGIERIPLLVLSHFHADHVGGLGRLLGSRKVDLVLTSPLESPAASAAWVRESVTKAGATVRPTRLGEQVSVGQATWLTLAAGAVAGTETTGEGESSAENDSSVVGRASSAGLEMLVTGDVEPAGQRALLSAVGERALRADVLKVPHHGSSRQDSGFLEATGARLALISCGMNNSYGHPAAKTLRLLEGIGMQVLRTDRQGSIAIASSAGRPTIIVQR